MSFDKDDCKTINVNVRFEGMDALLRLLQSHDHKLDSILEQGRQILMTEQEATAILNKIDATTTNMSTTQKSDADLLQKISDEVDALKTTPGVPPSVADRLGTLSDTLQLLSDNGDSQAAILAGIAAKGAPVVPPTPVPTPVPAP